MFKRLFKSFGKKPLSALELLRQGLDRPPSERDPNKLMPIILPATLLEMEWPGPIVRIGQLPFAVAWAVLGEQNIFFYVTHEQAAYWEGQGLDWRRTAFDNLIQLAHRPPGPRHKLDDDGQPFIKILLQDDAIGPSRLLVPGLFEHVFGTSYYVAIPEQTCAVAYRKELTAEQSADVDGMINGCFEHGTEPMSAERFDAAAFWNVPGVAP